MKDTNFFPVLPTFSKPIAEEDNLENIIAIQLCKARRK